MMTILMMKRVILVNVKLVKALKTLKSHQIKVTLAYLSQTCLKLEHDMVGSFDYPLGIITYLFN